MLRATSSEPDIKECGRAMSKASTRKERLKPLQGHHEAQLVGTEDCSCNKP